MRVVFRRLAGALCYQCAVLSVRCVIGALCHRCASTTLLALGFGAGYISLAVVLARFWGAGVFAQVLGVNYLIAGILQAISPGLAGWTYGLTGSYRIAFISATLLSRLGGLCTWFLRVPSPPGEIESMPG